MTFTRNPLCPLLIVLATAFGAAAAQDASDAPDAGEADKAELQRTVDFVSSLAAFTVDVEMSFNITGKSGEDRSATLTGKLALSGKDKARFAVTVEDGSMELFYAPDSKYIYISSQKQYVEGSTFGERQQALALMPSREFRPAQILLTDFLHGESSLFEAAESFEVVPPEIASPEVPEQTRVRGGGIVTDYWVRKGDQPVLEKFTMDLSQLATASNPDLASATVTYTFSNWNLKPAFDAAYFNFAIPEDATEFRQPDPGGPDPMVGKPAPDLKLGLFGGEGSLDLAAHKGKDVVILDFWASWCGPCRIGLPIVAEVAAQFKDKNVVLYAINASEDPRLVQAFVEETGLAATIAMDSNHDAQRKYQVNSLPRTVIIDKDGIIQKVHAGVSQTYRSDLTRELAALTE